MQQAAMPPDDFDKRKKKPPLPPQKDSRSFHASNRASKNTASQNAHNRPAFHQISRLLHALKPAPVALLIAGLCFVLLPVYVMRSSSISDFPYTDDADGVLTLEKAGVSVQVAHLEKINGVSFATLQISRQDTLKSKSMSINVYDTRTEEDDPNSYSADVCTWIDMPFGVDTMYQTLALSGSEKTDLDANDLSFSVDGFWESDLRSDYDFLDEKGTMSDEDLLKAYRELGDQNYTVQLTDDGRDSSYSTIAFSLSWPDDRPNSYFGHVNILYKKEGQTVFADVYEMKPSAGSSSFQYVYTPSLPIPDYDEVEVLKID